MKVFPDGNVQGLCQKLLLNRRPTSGSNLCFSQCRLHPTPTLLLRPGESVKLIFSCTSGCFFLFILFFRFVVSSCVVVSEKGLWAGSFIFTRSFRGTDPRDVTVDCCSMVLRDGGFTK